MRSIINSNIVKNIKTSCVSVIVELELDVSRSKVCRNLKALQYFYKALPWIFQISKLHKEKRVAAARSHITENIDWNQVIFSDEKLFSLHVWFILHVVRFKSITVLSQETHTVMRVNGLGNDITERHVVFSNYGR